MRHINIQRTSERAAEPREEARGEPSEETAEYRESDRMSHTVPPHMVARQQQKLDKWSALAAEAREASEETTDATEELTLISVEDVSRELTILEAEAAEFSPIQSPRPDESLIIVTDTESEAASLGDIRLSGMPYTEISVRSSPAMSSTTGLIAPVIYTERWSHPRRVSPRLLSPDRASTSTASPLALPLPTTPDTPATVRNSPLDLRATMNKTPVVIKPPITPRDT